MPGNTTRVERSILELQWDAYIPMAAICQHWTITKDQLVRLRDVWELPLRLDRKRRYKPSRLERMLDPDEDELVASQASLDLAPMVAERVTCVQATWSEEVRAERQAIKPEPFRLARIETPEEMQDCQDLDDGLL
jgi:hypothetical protein